MYVYVYKHRTISETERRSATSVNSTQNDMTDICTKQNIGTMMFLKSPTLNIYIYIYIHIQYVIFYAIYILYLQYAHTYVYMYIYMNMIIYPYMNMIIYIKL